jgi:ADP-ribose pyrophosphatase
MQLPKTIKTERHYHGRVFDLILEEIEYSSGNRTTREIASHPGGAVVVPLLENGNIIFVRQFRYPHKQFVIELPAGKLEPNEDPLVCAKRELQEETGYHADKIEKLTAIYTTPGFCNETLHIYLATGLSKSEFGQKLEEGELSLTIETIPLTKAIEMIEQGEIVDSKTICGILLT